MSQERNWKRRIKEETGMSFQEAIILLARRGHSKSGAAKILGLSRYVFFTHCNEVTDEWKPWTQTIEFLEGQANRELSAVRLAQLRRIQHQRTQAAQLTVRGVTGTLEQLARHFGKVSPRAAFWRRQRGWSVEEAVTRPACKTPPKPCNTLYSL